MSDPYISGYEIDEVKYRFPPSGLDPAEDGSEDACMFFDEGTGGWLLLMESEGEITKYIWASANLGGDGSFISAEYKMDAGPPATREARGFPR